MEFGVLILTQHPVDRRSKQARDEVVQQAVTIDRLDYDSLFFIEHHFMDDYHIFDNLLMAANIAGRTDSLQLGTGIFLLPYVNPLLVAERIATLDLLNDGRFVFGVGKGYRKAELDALGIDRSERDEKMEENIQLLRRLWTEDDVTFSGSHVDVADVTINPKPLQPRGPPIWIGANSPAGVRLAANRGDAWMTGPRESIAELERLFEAYEAALDGSPASTPIIREAFVAETRDEAFESAGPFLLNKYNQYMSWRGRDPVAMADFRDHAEDRYLIGTPDDVIAGIEDYRAAFGIDHLILRTQWPGMDWEEAKGSIELVSDEVVPSF